ncbi:transposase [Geomicrobium sp. JCM 19055]|nr:transposase [Geomicrobium sp. JCM 19055]
MKATFQSYSVERQAQKVCMGMIKLSERHSLKRFEDACQQALLYSPVPKLNSIKTILKHGTEAIIQQANEKPSSSHSFTRGANYFGGKRS